MIGKKSTNKRDMLKEELKPNLNIVKEATILFDGRQFMIKIPKEISNFYKIKKGNKLKMIVTPIKKNQGENSFEIIK